MGGPSRAAHRLRAAPQAAGCDTAGPAPVGWPERMYIRMLTTIDHSTKASSVGKLAGGISIMMASTIATHPSHFGNAALANMPGCRRKLRLVIDWTVALLFDRGTAELGALERQPRLPGTPSEGAEDILGPGTRRDP